MDIIIIDGDQLIRLLKPGRQRISGAPGDTISLIPLADVDGITTRGLQYPLEQRFLALGSRARHQQCHAGGQSVHIELRAGLAAARPHKRARLMSAFTIIKLDAQGNFELSYAGTLHAKADDFVCIDAVFALPDRDLGAIRLRRGDRFREWFYR